MYNSQNLKDQNCDQLEFGSESNQITRVPISIFTQIRGRKKEEHKMLLEKLRKALHSDFKIGAAAGRGDCFFDSVAQRLNELKNKGQVTSSKNFNAKLLREDCANYAKQYEFDVSSWVYRGVMNDNQ
ncbi:MULTISPECIES: hypothetical protein [unclassified Wolbachia]|uniref:hypothetical protein n=1 Tax=unclassified Wolbachia TaxID=2640676 RepID=UPI00222E52E6|nr:hypothetical protein [Wolbachia endosymbiont (group A) of Macropis europaea]